MNKGMGSAIIMWIMSVELRINPRIRVEIRKMEKEPTKEMIEAWDKRFKAEGTEPTLGQMVGGCPSCGHMCSFTDEFHCHRCGWDWKDESSPKTTKARVEKNGK